MDKTFSELGFRSDASPKVSIIIVTKGLRKTLSETLESLARQTVTDFEILLVSNPSPYAEELARQYGCRFYQISNEWFIGQVRNFGVQHSLGEVVVFIDDDCVASTNWLKELIAPLDDCVGATMGKVLPFSTDTLSQRLAILDFDWGRKMKSLKALATCNCAIKRGIFNKIKFTEETHTTEDYALGRSIYASGYEIRYVAKAVIKHHHRSTMIEYWRQIFAWGRDFSIWAFMEQLQPFSTLEVMYALAGWFFVLGGIFLATGYLFPAQLMFALALFWEAYPFQVYLSFLRWQIEDLPYDVGNLYIYAFHRFVKEQIFALGKVGGIYRVHKIFKEEYTR